MSEGAGVAGIGGEEGGRIKGGEELLRDGGVPFDGGGYESAECQVSES